MDVKGGTTITLNGYIKYVPGQKIPTLLNL